VGIIEAPIDEALFQPCAKYANMEEAYGYCLYKFSGGFRSREDVERFCSQGGEWELECRHAWVSGRMQPNSGLSTTELLEACGENPDCTFELLDFRPNDDILVQIDLCSRFVKRHIRDCVGHAMQRWWYTKPDAEEVARVMGKTAPVPDRVSFYTAASVECKGVGSCDGEKYLERLCLKNVRHFEQNPDACPPQHEKPMAGKFNPNELKPKSGAGSKVTPNAPPTPKFKGDIRKPPGFKPKGAKE
jgi:hypothetical protein